jgi:phage terminase large subunit-like protein
MVKADALRQAARAAREFSERVQRDPLEEMRWLVPQFAFLSSEDKWRLLRAGNQSLGKSTVGCAEAVYRALGEHPYKPVPEGPTEGWIICASWDQSIAIQKKIWDLLPKHQIDPKTKFDPVNGFGFHHPSIRFKNGSLIRIKTCRQGALNLSGATIDWFMFDEPPPHERLFAELVKRVQARNGCGWITMTPVNAPTEWIKEAVEEGQITDLHFRLEPENLVFVDDFGVPTEDRIRLDDGTVCDGAWIDKVIAETLSHEVPVVIHGEWEMRIKDVFLDAFRASGDESHVTRSLPGEEMQLALGIDHGSGTGHQVAVLIGVIDHAFDDGGPEVWVLDAVESNGRTTTQDDAVDVLRMLHRNGLEWEHLDFAYGDRMLGSRHDPDRKSNVDLERAIKHELGLRSGVRLRPRIRSAKRGKGRGRGAPSRGWRFLHERMIKPDRFHVHSDCAIVINSLLRWDGRDGSEHKHSLDALRYGLDPWIFDHRSRPRGPKVTFRT